MQTALSPNNMKTISFTDLQQNPAELIGKQWMLITAGTQESFNTMTASWGGLGFLWNRPVAFVFVRPNRHTAKFIDEQGGDIRKMFSVDKDAFDLLKNIYSASDKASLIGFEKADNKQIIEALSEVVETGKAKDSLDKLYAIFRNNDNAFLRKAKIMNSSFNFAILFLIAPVVFGWFIPKLNEALTKKRQFEKHEQNKGVNEPKLEKAQVNEAKDTEKFSTIQTMAAKNIKKSVAFKEFIGA